ncbi:diguanylate cyclase [Vibrio variabilis]|uniref:Diguanylate cyclase n=1 Tax=Vibrio variabilis TaxID=990271 RepID=A0ABQ0JE23_9VIBR|nr:diguanylate cyclase [Vibrio variabilis]
MSSKNLPTLQQFIDALDDHIWVKDANGEYIAVNEASEIAWQRHRNDIYGKTDDDLFDAERARHFKQVDDQIISHGSQHTVEECAALDKRGNEVWLETVKSPIHNESGEFVGIIGMTRNATRRKQVEARLSITSEIFNNFQEGMMITDHNARIMDVNRAFTVLTGYQESEVIGENRVSCSQAIIAGHSIPVCGINLKRTVNGKGSSLTVRRMGLCILKWRR